MKACPESNSNRFILFYCYSSYLSQKIKRKLCWKREPLFTDPHTCLNECYHMLVVTATPRFFFPFFFWLIAFQVVNGHILINTIMILGIVTQQLASCSSNVSDFSGLKCQIFALMTFNHTGNHQAFLHSIWTIGFYLSRREQQGFRLDYFTTHTKVKLSKILVFEFNPARAPPPAALYSAASPWHDEARADPQSTLRHTPTKNMDPTGPFEILPFLNRRTFCILCVTITGMSEVT